MQIGKLSRKKGYCNRIHEEYSQNNVPSREAILLGGNERSKETRNLLQMLETKSQWRGSRKRQLEHRSAYYRCRLDTESAIVIEKCIVARALWSAISRLNAESTSAPLSPYDELNCFADRIAVKLPDLSGLFRLHLVVFKQKTRNRGKFLDRK